MVERKQTTIRLRTLPELFLLKERRRIWKALMHFGFLADRELKRVQAEFPRILSLAETLDRLQNGASISRFGDGELSGVLGSKLSFQKGSRALAQRLTEVLASPEEDGLLISLADLDLHAERIHEKDRRKRYGFYPRFWLRSWRFLKQYLIRPVYANTQISRVEVFREVPLDKIKAIWENRDVVFIVPPNGRFKFDDRLFGNIRSAVYVDVPPIDAFDHYPDILAEALKHDEDKLYYIAAGPTATVLAYDLHKTGRQALDLGHLTNCYLEYLGEADRPECYAMQTD